MTLESGSFLKTIMTNAERGRPLTTRWLTDHGVSPQLAHHYVSRGILTRLGSGYYMLAGDSPILEYALAVAMRDGHVGGKSALAWHGYQHNLYLQDITLIYSHGKARVSSWLSKYFRVDIRNRHIFKSEDIHCIRPWRNSAGAPVSEPERAVLEMLSDVPTKQSMEEAGFLVEMLYGLRPKLMQAMLRDCQSIKTVRLFLHLAQNADLPVVNQLDLDEMSRGSDSDYVIKTPGNLIRLRKAP